MLFVSAGTHDHEEVFTNLLNHCHSSRKFLRHTKSSEVSRKMGHSLAVISVRIHENPSKCGVQLFSQNTKLSISPQECKIFLTKYITEATKPCVWIFYTTNGSFSKGAQLGSKI